MKQRKTIFLTILTIGVIFLVSSSMLSYSNSFALIETNNEQVNLNSADRMNWGWTTPEVVSTESTDRSYFPEIAVDSSGNVYLVWRDQTNYASCGSDWDIFFKKWDASTEAWSTTEVISTLSSADSNYPDIAVDTAGNIHIIWDDDTADYANSGIDTDIFYRQWTASNSSWGNIHVVSTEGSSVSDESSLCIDSSGNVYIVWKDSSNYDLSGTDYDIFYKKWIASTESFTVTEVVSIVSSAISSKSDVAVDSEGNIHVCWQDETFRTEPDILYRRWDSSLSLWQSTEILNTGIDFLNRAPDIEADVEGNIHVVWSGQIIGGSTYYYLFYKKRNYNSTTWSSTDAIVSQVSNSIAYPKLALDDIGNKYLTWEVGTPSTDKNIMFKYWNPYTSLWSQEEVISIVESAQSVRESSISVDKLGHIHLVWSDETDYLTSGSDEDILYRKFIGPPEIPKLALIIPLTIETSGVNLEWDDSYGATAFYIYRSTHPIWSVDGLTPIDTTANTFYADSLPAEDTYFYSIVAGNYAGNSSVSNLAYVEYKIPHVREFTIATSLLLGVAVISFFVFRKRKKG